MSFYLNRKYKEWITNMHDAWLALELDTRLKQYYKIGFIEVVHTYPLISNYKRHIV